MNLTKKTAITILLLVILIGAALRFYRLGATSFVADEFLDINSSMAYAKTGIWQNWDFNFGQVNKDNVFEARDSRAWIYKWQVAQALNIFGASEASARAVSAVWGLISIVLIYFVAAYFTKKKEIGLLSAALFAISITGIIFDRKLRMYAMFFPVYLGFSWMFYRFLEEDYGGKIKICRLIWEKAGINIAYFVPMLILGIISVLTHQLTGNIVAAFIFYCIVWLYLSGKRKMPAVNKYSLGISVFAVGLIGGFIMFPDEMRLYTKELKFFSAHLSYFSKVLFDYSNAVLAVLFLAAGIYYMHKIKNLKKEALWLGASFFAVFFSAVFLWNRNVGDQYIFFITSFSTILISCGIYWAVEFFGRNFGSLGKYQYIAPLIVIFLILPNWGYFFEESNTYKQTSASSSANYKKVFGYFMKAKKEGEVLITRNFRNFYWKGAKIKVYDFGGELSEEKLSKEDIIKTASENKAGWVIFSDNDDAYVSSEAMEYIVKNFERVSNPQVRGNVMVYRWGSGE